MMINSELVRVDSWNFGCKHLLSGPLRRNATRSSPLTPQGSLPFLVYKKGRCGMILKKKDNYIYKNLTSSSIAWLGHLEDVYPQRWPLTTCFSWSVLSLSVFLHLPKFIRRYFFIMWRPLWRRRLTQQGFFLDQTSQMSWCTHGETRVKRFPKWKTYSSWQTLSEPYST